MRDRPTYELVPSKPSPLLAPRHAEFFRARLERSKERLRRAVTRVEQHARKLSLDYQVRHDPYAWALGAVAFGFVLGALTRSRR